MHNRITVQYARDIQIQSIDGPYLLRAGICTKYGLPKCLFHYLLIFNYLLNFSTVINGYEA